jgi:hypothetical protein
MLAKLEAKINELSTTREAMVNALLQHRGEVERLTTIITKIDGALEITIGLVDAAKAEAGKPEPVLSDVAVEAIKDMADPKPDVPVVPPNYGGADKPKKKGK